MTGLTRSDGPFRALPCSAPLSRSGCSPSRPSQGRQAHCWRIRPAAREGGRCAFWALSLPPCGEGCVGDLWSPFLEPERRCFASAMCEATVGWGPFLYYPHPGSLRLASTSRASFARLGPRKGEGKEKQGRLWTALSCLAIWVAEEILRTLRIFREIRTDADASGKRTALPG